MEARNPVFTAGGKVVCEVQHPDLGWVPFTASDEDPEAHGRAIFAAIISGEFGQIAPYVPPPPPALTGADIDRERDRRVMDGLVVTVAGYGEVSLQGRDIDMRNLHGLATAAQLRIAGGAGATQTPFRDKANVIHELTQAQILDLWSQGAAFVSAVFQSAWALKDNPPIPADYAEDTHWP